MRAKVSWRSETCQKFVLSVCRNEDLLFLCGAMDEMNYGKKGSCFLQFLVFMILFVILLIWVYNKNSSLTF
jgi:hypothetical protein